MRFRYREFDGQEFAGQESLSRFSQFMEFVLEYGDHALDALRRAEMDAEQSELLDKLVQDGMLEKVGARWRLTPRAVDAMQRKALMEVFSNLRKGTRDGHETREPGQLGERTEGTRPYEFGDPVSELELNATLRNTLKRTGPGTPLRIGEQDFELHQSEHQTSCSTVILLDMSGSMARYHRFYHAKKCAMAMHALISQRFPRDTVDVVGFYSGAGVIPDYKLPLISPKPVTVFDYEVRLRVPLAKIDEAPQHFTNLQMGLMLARRILARRGGDNKQVFIITDGEPTAHVQGDYVYLLYPPQKATTISTLKEAVQINRQGIRICTFALAEDYAYLDWVGFVDQLTRVVRGVAFYCASGNLADCIMESYLSGRKRKTYVG
ncbi:MAG: VWA domain-containing protein [Planctomycetes bacterium]|nr:VWA domain-containing protein [Planctomycetota bacterium]